MAQVVDVFIAAPNDVRTERKDAEDVVRLVSMRTRDNLDIVLNTVSWPNFLPSATRCISERVQDRFTSRIRKCGIFIGILYQRYGTEIDTLRTISGTEEEFDAAIKNRHTIELLTYFRSIPEAVKSDKSIVEQISKLLILQARLQKEGILYHRYKEPDEFRERFILDLFETVVRIRTEAERREQLNSFFRFGVSKKRESPSVVLAYPPIHKHVQEPFSVVEGQVAGKGQRRHKYNWRERLLPNVVYEDVKCIQKIEAAVRLAGVHDIRIVTIDYPGLQPEPGNMIWLCLPRNDIASKCLARLGTRSWFGFERRPGSDRPHILWRPSGNAPFEIESPMAKYLQIQNRPQRSVWHPDFGKIVARDYAIIGRFAMRDLKGHTHNDPYYYYFVAGIRGLGTWGAGWFIERRPDELQRLSRITDSNSQDMQLVLEVTFSNYRIATVEDVSDKDETYFEKQNDAGVIRSVIDEFSYSNSRC
ncbi:MAG: DUF4062 domain-containing protein [Syntrophobacteraceae bacterium]